MQVHGEAALTPHTPDDAASVGLLDSLGFTLEGHLRERHAAGDEEYRANVYGLLAKERGDAHG